MEGSDDQIVRAVLAGDKDAYGALVRRHSQMVFRVAFRITGDEADADEVVQEAFMRGYQRLEGFESRAGFGTWIYRIAVNSALNLVGRRRSEAMLQIADDADPAEQQVQVADSAAGPERVLLSREIEAMGKRATIERFVIAQVKLAGVFILGEPQFEAQQTTVGWCEEPMTAHGGVLGIDDLGVDAASGGRTRR